MGPGNLQRLPAGAAEANGTSGREEPAALVWRLVAQARQQAVQCQHALAEEGYRQALAVVEGSLAADHPAAVACRKEIALMCRVQGRDSEAERHYQELLSGLDPNDAGELPEVLEITSALAEIFREQGRYLEATDAYTRLAELKEAVLGREHPEVGYALIALADVYAERKMTAAEESCLRAAFAVLRGALGPAHSRTTACLKRLVAAQETLRLRAEAQAADVDWQG